MPLFFSWSALCPLPCWYFLRYFQHGRYNRRVRRLIVHYAALLIPIHAVMKGLTVIFAQIPLRSALALTDKAEKAETGTAKNGNPQNFRVFLTSKLQRKEYAAA